MTASSRLIRLEAARAARDRRRDAATAPSMQQLAPSMQQLIESGSPRVRRWAAAMERRSCELTGAGWETSFPGTWADDPRNFDAEVTLLIDEILEIVTEGADEGEAAPPVWRVPNGWGHLNVYSDEQTAVILKLESKEYRREIS